MRTLKTIWFQLYDILEKAKPSRNVNRLMVARSLRKSKERRRKKRGKRGREGRTWSTGDF